MTEPTGGLIHMTAHMIRTAEALRLIWVGMILAGICLFLALCASVSRNKEHKWRYVAAFVALALLGAGMAYAGHNKPMRKVIYCCASGPVSLEMVAGTYDIIEVDGSFLKLAER